MLRPKDQEQSLSANKTLLPALSLRCVCAVVVGDVQPKKKIVDAFSHFCSCAWPSRLLWINLGNGVCMDGPYMYTPMSLEGLAGGLQLCYISILWVHTCLLLSNVSSLPSWRKKETGFLVALNTVAMYPSHPHSLSYSCLSLCIPSLSLPSQFCACSFVRMFVAILGL